MRQRQGVALPVALFGLVVVSIMVTAALVTASTELTLSRAHQAGIAELYEADRALESFVAQRAGIPADSADRLAAGSYAVAVGGKGYSVSVGRVFQGVPEAVAGGFEAREVFSLLVSPASGRGRSVGAFLELSRLASDISFHIDSGLTLGGDIAISEDASIGDGASLDVACDSSQVGEAVRHAEGTEVSRQGDGHQMYGGIVQDTRTSGELMEHVLNGHDLAELSERATIRFGPMFGEAPFAGVVSQLAGDSEYRWGCPTALVTGCTTPQATFYPTVVIDADGEAVDISGDHGQGILVILNGDVRLGGDFQYAGIILVEGAIHLAGTSRVEGGVVAMGEVAGAETGASLSGSSSIRFNRCQIVEAQRALTIASVDSAPQMMGSPTVGWFEVIR